MPTSGNEDDYDSAEKFSKYEEDFTKYLMDKYFSDEDTFGAKIYVEEAKIGDGIIKSSRFPCTYSYADPVRAFLDQHKTVGSSSQHSADPVEPVKPNRKKAVKSSATRSTAEPVPPVKADRTKTHESSASRSSAEPVRPVHPDSRKTILDLNADPVEISSDDDGEAGKVSDAIEDLELAQNAETAQALLDLSQGVPCPDVGTSSGVPDKKSKSKLVSN